MGCTFDGENEGNADAPAAHPAPRRSRSAAAVRFRLRQILTGGAQAEILASARASLSRGGGGARAPGCLTERVARLAAMAASGDRTEEIAAWLDALPFSRSRKATLVADAARRIGEGWVCDDLDFVAVTTAVGRLQAAWREVGQQTLPTRVRHAGSALIACAPGETHTFGLVMVEDLFRADGWATSTCTPKGPAELVERLRRQRPQAVCVSWSSDCLKSNVAAIVGACLASGGVVVFGGQAALRHDAWLRGRGVANICDKPDAALDLCRSTLLRQNRRESLEAEQERVSFL